MNNISNYLRMAMMFSDNHARTFISNLEKMIEVILSESAPKAMLVDEVVDLLAEQYSLKFTDVEVRQAIEGHRGKEHIRCINAQTKRLGDRKYILNQETLDSITERKSKLSVESICSLFLDENQGIKISVEALSDLVKRYFYRCFNSNATTIMQLLKQEYTDGVLLSNSDLDAGFKDDEKEILNSFIYWDNTEKDKFVYRMVSCCFDYCTMTAKKDQSVYETVFKNKAFVLDTNIIFRIMGINRGNRKILIDSFLEKCREVGIELIVTNVTRAEMRNTIIYNAEQIANLISNSPPVNPKYLKGCANTGVNVDFYEYYYEWCQKPGNKRGDIIGFREYVLNRADAVCRSFSNKVYTVFSIRNRELYEAYVQSLKEYKTTYKGHTPRIETIETDVNNFMYVVGMNERQEADDFFGLNYFHISADHPFCDWAKGIRCGAIPEVILPSVWYSIILHYSGRATSDDYASFTRFLNFSLPANNEEKSEKKTILIQKTARLDEPIDVKEEIIQDVAKKLSSEYRDADDEIIDELIKASCETATERRVNAAIEREQAAKNEALRNQDDTHAAELKQMREDIAELKLTNQNLRDEMNKRLDDKDKENQENEKKARQEERNNHIEIEAKECAKRKKIQYIIAFVLCILVPLGGAGFGIYKVWTTELTDAASAGLTALCGVVVIILEYIVFKVLYENWFCELQRERIVEREKRRLEDKYPKIQ